MKLAAAILMIVCILTGCSPKNTELDLAMDMRKQLLEADSCTFDATITADYTDSIYTFQMSCCVSSTGALDFTVTDPETISGITGTVSDADAALTFDDKVLAFPVLADGMITPVSAPWIFVKTLRDGYISGCAESDDALMLSVDDSYEENPLHLEICADSQLVPVSAEIYYQQKRVISLDIRNFTLL